MLNKKILILICLVSIFAVLQPILALTADSSSYSVARFGTGIQAGNLSSDNFEARDILVTGASTRNAENDEYTANIGFWGNTTYYRTVSISSYSISPSSAVVGSTIGLYINALNSQKVWAKIISPNNQEQTLTLINSQTVNYVPSPAVVGRYNVTFYANSSTGAIASAVDYFDFTEQTTIITSPPSGGTTRIIEKCTYNWDCTPWRLCTNGKQKRECENIGTCTGTEGKPKEEINCSAQLFDIVIKQLIAEPLTQNRTIKFRIDLIDKIGTEIFDVYMKYSIINSNNTEILSRIETKAVKQNLTYEKELDEIRLADGEYTLRVDILYGNLQRAFAEQNFKVEAWKIEITPKKSISKLNYKIIILSILGIGGLILILWIISIILILKRRKKNFLKERLDEGLRYINEGKTNEAKLTYEYIKNAYNSNKKTYQEMYPKIMEFYNKILENKPLLTLVGFIGAVFLIFSLLGSNIIGGVIGTGKIKTIIGVIIFLVILGIALLIILRNKLYLICKRIIEVLSEIINRNKKYPSNNIKGLINKKVYSENGDYIGKVKDTILGENKIESLKIKIDKKHNFKAKGMVIDYHQVKSAGEMIIISNKILEYIENYENKRILKKEVKKSNE